MKYGVPDDENPEITRDQMRRAMPAQVHRRWRRGELEAGDVAALRKFVGLSQPDFAAALGISVGTLRNWEQSIRNPTGPALALLRIIARNPRVLHFAMPDARKSA